jgi:Spy/CpxP family protein refolding chaperone
MMPFVLRRLLPVVVVLSVSGSAWAQPMAWWKTDSTKKELGLTADQSSRIDAVFQEALVQLRQQKDDLDTLEGKLSHLIEISADETQVNRQIDRVEADRAVLNKTRTLMLLHMRQLLTPDQRVKLVAMRDRWEQEQRHTNGRAADVRKRPE